EVWMEEGREFPELDGPLGRLGLRVQRVPREALDDMVGEGLARGVVVHAEPPASRPLDQLLSAPKPAGARRRILVALDEVGDPGNLGAIMRSAEFFGTVGILWTKDRAAPLSAL